MTEDEARRISQIVQQADGGCPHCIGLLEDLLNHYFPDFTWGDGNTASDWLIRDCEGSVPEVLFARQAQPET